jgi:hypothetical protein
MCNVLDAAASAPVTVSACSISRSLLRGTSETRIGRVAASTYETTYVIGSDFALCISGQGVPRLPVTIEVSKYPQLIARQGCEVRWEPGSLRFESGAAVRWSTATPVWEPRPKCADRSERAVRERGEILASALAGQHWRGERPDLLDQMLDRLGGVIGNEDARPLFGALVNRDLRQTREVASRLIGRGSGSTPQGDDLLASIASTMIAVGRVCGYQDAVARALTAALLPPHSFGRTTALGAALLTAAAEGEVAEPAHELLTSEATAEALRRPLWRILRIGQSTGLTYALGITASLLIFGARGLRS